MNPLILGDYMRFSNLHTHTTYSDGVGTVRENIESAISKNMLSLGFSDHSYTACDTSYCMKLSDYDKYLSEIENMKKEYKDKLPIYTGLEKDYYSEIDRSCFDYIIASVHYIIRNGICYPIDHSGKQQMDCVADAFGGNVYDMAKCFFDMVAEQAAKVKPDVIGHFDVINKFSLMPENEDKFINIAMDSMKETIKHCKCFEINTGAVANGYRKNPYPNKVLLELLLNLGGEVVIDSDSHKPANLDFYFKESVNLLKDVGFHHFCVFDGNGFDKINI